MVRPSLESALLLLLLCSLPGCNVNPYETLDDESLSLGAVDPIDFPLPNLGLEGERGQPGMGRFVETTSRVAGVEMGYFGYPVNTAADDDPLLILDVGDPFEPVPVPLAYVFDATQAQPVPPRNPCLPPAGHRPDPRLDAVSFEQQGNLFTDLPTAIYDRRGSETSYVPVVAEATAGSAGYTCQEFKSEKSLAARMGRLPEPSGRYLAWLIIDPSAAVLGREDPERTVKRGLGLGLQRWGWYNRFLVAYLEGGYIPTEPVTVTDEPTMGSPLKRARRMLTQRLYIPRSPVIVDGEMKEGAVGEGYDVLAARRGQPGYSPVCEVVTYQTRRPLPPEMLPTDSRTIEASFGPILPAEPRYLYCLQVR